jgi:tetratricopeptide (TPR) repeat protein
LSIGPKLPARALKYFAGLPGEWTLVFLDECGAVFLREEPRNRQLIKQHAIDLSRYVAPAADLKRLGAAKVYPWAYLRRAEAWQAMGKDDLAIQEAVQAIRVSPDCARAYYILGKAYLRRLK